MQQRAFEYCKDKPHLALLPSIIMNMSVVHRRWRSLFRLERDDHEVQTRWRDAFAQACFNQRKIASRKTPVDLPQVMQQSLRDSIHVGIFLFGRKA